MRSGVRWEEEVRTPRTADGQNSGSTEGPGKGVQGVQGIQGVQCTVQEMESGAGSGGEVHGCGVGLQVVGRIKGLGTVKGSGW